MEMDQMLTLTRRVTWGTVILGIQADRIGAFFG